MRIIKRRNFGAYFAVLATTGLVTVMGVFGGIYALKFAKDLNPPIYRILIAVGAGSTIITAGMKLIVPYVEDQPPALEEYRRMISVFGRGKQNELVDQHRLGVESEEISGDSGN